MGKFNPRLSAISAVVIAALVFAVVAVVGDAPNKAVAISGDQLPRTITVLGDGSVTVSPDQALLSMGTRATDSSAAEALDGVAAKTAELVAALKSSGIAAEDITTSGLSVYPRHNRRLQTKTYTASTQVMATVRDIARVGPVIDEASAALGNSLQIDGLELMVSDPEKSLGEARDAALANAEKRAKEYADGIGASLGSVVQVSEIGGAPAIDYERAYGSADMATAASFVVEPGTQDLIARISVLYAIG